MEFIPGTVYFAGAGPGDPELITVKTLALIRSVGMILYAGSLVNPKILAEAQPGTLTIDTAHMKLSDQIEWMQHGASEGKVIARLHTGDPSIYSSISEEIYELDLLGIPWKIIPGVTAAFSAAAELGIEYTIPDITQSLILTRISGRTMVPERESIRSFASHGSSLAIYLSTDMLEQLTEELCSGGYPPDTDAAVIYRASWPDQKIVRGTLSDIAERTRQAEITHQALVIISPALIRQTYKPSYLYNTFQTKSAIHKPGAIICLSESSVIIGRRIKAAFPDYDWYVPEQHLESASSGALAYRYGVRQILQESFRHYNALICVMASGIIVRELAPLIQNKHTDPAIIVADNAGQYWISLLSGHIGGGNLLARKLAEALGGQAVITTASDTQELPALDLIIRKYGWTITSQSTLTAVMAALVNGRPVAFSSDFPVPNTTDLSRLPLTFFDNTEAISTTYSYQIVLSNRVLPRSAQGVTFLQLIPNGLVLGIGCNRGTEASELESACRKALSQSGFDIRSVDELATIPEKAEEPGIRILCEKMHWKLTVISHEQVNSIQDLPNPSQIAHFVLGVNGVSEPCALSAAGSNKLVIKKIKFPNVTVAAAQKELFL